MIGDANGENDSDDTHGSDDGPYLLR